MEGGWSKIFTELEGQYLLQNIQYADFCQVRIQGIRGSYRLIRIAEQLFVSPVVTISRLARTYDVLYPTSKADVDKLIKVGILELLPGTYPKAFFAPEIYQITYEDQIKKPTSDGD